MSGASKVRIAPWRALTDEQCRSHAAGRAEVPTSLAGRALALVEWVRGEGAVTGEVPGIPRNPQGLWGHDHSGPPYGLAFQSPIAALAGNDGSSWTRRVGAVQLFQRYEVGGSTEKALHLRGTIWVRPFTPHLLAPHSRGYVRFRARNTTAGSVTLTVRVLQADGEVHTSTFTVNATTFSDRLVGSYLRLQPGQNPVSIRFFSSSTSIVTRIASVSLNQTVARTH